MSKIREIIIFSKYEMFVNTKESYESNGIEIIVDNNGIIMVK